jgi:hypothetical protein
LVLRLRGGQWSPMIIPQQCIHNTLS